MPPDHAKSFAGGITDSALNPGVLAAMLLAIVLMLALRRKYALVPFLCISFLAPLGQAVVLGGMHFYVGRIVVLAGLLRTFRGSVTAPGNGIDRRFIACILCQAVAVSLLFADTSALVNQIGFLLDFLGTYFILRHFIQDEDDLYRCLKVMSLICVILAAGMVIEQVKDLNIFGLIGGSKLVPEIRDGKIRAQGVFEHELTAGAFGATLIPLFCLFFRQMRSRMFGVIGVIAATVITITSNSSTSLLAYAGGIGALAAWKLREKMRNVRWSIVALFVSLSLVMKAPVWFIIARIDLTGSSSGYHRAMVIDAFVNHFSNWWLMGVKSTGSWGWDLWDTQNEFVNVGEAGGLLALVLFIAMIVSCFSRLGKSRLAVQGDSGKEALVWMLGSALFAHIVAFFGVNYFDQSRVAFLMLLAMICTVPVTAPETAVEQGEDPAADSEAGEAGSFRGWDEVASQHSRGSVFGQP